MDNSVGSRSGNNLSEMGSGRGRLCPSPSKSKTPKLARQIVVLGLFWVYLR